MPTTSTQQTAPLTDSSVKSRPNDSIVVIRCFIALVFVFTTYWLLNYCAFPLFDEVSIWTREISAGVGGVALVVIALVALWRPDLFHHHFLSGILVALGFGYISMLAGLFFSSEAPLYIGSSLATIGISLVSVIVGIACTKLNIRIAGICIAGAYTLSYLLRFAFSSFPIDINLLLFIFIPFITVLLTYSIVKPMLKKILGSEAPAQTAVTTPSSMLPFAHQVFITLVIFRFIYGYTLTFGETDRTPLMPLFALIPLALYALYLFVRKKPLEPDPLFRISILFCVAGFLVPAAAGEAGNYIASNLLTSGTGFFEILMYFVLVALAVQNKSNALVVLTWGNAMASLGTIIGANFGRLTNHYYNIDHTALSLISAGIVFALVVYIVATLHNFSFSESISKVAPESSKPIPSGERSPDFEKRCLALSETAGLTSRETEIFLLLAQGRNARFIQEKLVVSYNTVKTHVSHIYAKLNVHTHQEVIDLVEGKIDTP